MDMFTELNMWDKATSLANEYHGGADVILKRKAQVQEDRKDLTEAAKTYIEVGEYNKAIEILGPSGNVDELMDMVRKMSTKNIPEMQQCINYFKLHGNNNYAIETLTKLGDMSGLVKLFIELCQWDEAFKIAETDPQYSELILLPYGHWLASNDRFQEAQEYYIKAGRADEAIKVLKQLCNASIKQESYDDAAYYYHALSKESNTEKERNNDLAMMYHAYIQIHKYIVDPFTFSLPESLMNASIFLITKSNSNMPRGISRFYILYALAKMSRTLGYMKLSQWAFERLMALKIPLEWEDRIELGNLLARGRSGLEWSNPCFLCNAPVQFNQKFDGCIHCLNPTIRSLHSFDPLPLIKFEPTGVEISEALELISSESTGTFEMPPVISREVYEPLRLNYDQLSKLSPYQVFMKRIGNTYEFYLHVNDSQIEVTQCVSCQNFFGEEEWNYQFLLHGKCPFCRSKS